MEALAQVSIQFVQKSSALTSVRAKEDNLLIQAWLDSRRSFLTSSAYLQIVKKFFTQFSHLGLSEVKPIHVASFLKSLREGGASQATINKYTSALSSLFDFVIKADLDPSNHRFRTAVTINPTTPFDTKRVPLRALDTMPPSEAVRSVVLKVESSRNQLMLRCLAILGGRISEVLQIRVGHFYRDSNGNICQRVIGKRAKERIFHFTIELLEAIAEYAAEEGLKVGDYLFSSQKNRSKPLSRIQAYMIVREIGVSAEIELSPHLLRIWHTVEAYSNGADLLTLQQSLDHENIGTTQRYLRKIVDKRSSHYISTTVEPELNGKAEMYVALLSQFRELES